MKHHPYSVALALDDWRSAVAALDFDPNNSRVVTAVVTTRQRHKEAVKASLTVHINPDPPLIVLAKESKKYIPPFYASSVDDLYC